MRDNKIFNRTHKAAPVKIDVVDLSRDHSVWAVYDLLRTARLNGKYYSACIDSLKKRQLFLDLLLAVSVPSSAIAGLWFWEYSAGEIAWKALAIVTAVVAAVKPLLQYGPKVQAMEEVLSGYKALDHDLYTLQLDIQRERAYNSQLQNRFKEALARKVVLVGREVEHKEDGDLKRRLEKEVCEELPAEAFFVPEDNDE
ncbi:hypothetical protein [Candidatus Kuenenia sp.]|uniref:hypothetical protein n=1 Tax=Candidatus Kuenenia sp. TaxID=2499824 RepID=UPI00321F9386